MVAINAHLRVESLRGLQLLLQAKVQRNPQLRQMFVLQAL